MKTFRAMLLMVILTIGIGAHAQDWHANFPMGNTITGLEYLGCDAGSNQPLRLKTLPDLEIQMFTSDIRRFTLLPDNTYTVGGSTVVADGYSLHSPDVAAFYTGGAPGPFTLDHKAAATNSSFEDAFRDWAATGTTYTGGGTMGYVGLKGGDQSHTDLAIQLAKREGATAPDRIRFIFTDLLNGSSPNGADSQEGLEGMRLTAVSNSRVNVGFGDFNVLGGEPSETLDVGDGKVRIRQLPTDPEATTVEKVVVVDPSGVLGWRNVPVGPGSPGCEWQRTLPAQHVVSGYQPANTMGSCPDRAWLYGIGVASPSYKLQLQHSDLDRPSTGGILMNYLAQNSAPSPYGIHASLSPAQEYVANGIAILGTLTKPGTTGTGVQGQVTLNRPEGNVTSTHGTVGRVFASSGIAGTVIGALGDVNSSGTVISKAYGSKGISGGTSAIAENYGVHGESRTYGTVTSAYGVYARSNVQAGSATASYGVCALSNGPVVNAITNGFGVQGRAVNAVNNYSIYGMLPSGGTLNWSGFFEGPISASGIVFPSDQALKTDIQDLGDAMSLLMQLRPKSYAYRCEEYPQMGLPDGLRYGFIAQEVQAVFPQFVKPSHQPQHVDSLGIETAAAVDYLALNMMDMIPMVVGAVQQHHTATQEGMAMQTGELMELRAQLEEQRHRLEQVEQRLAQCCERPTTEVRGAESPTSVADRHSVTGEGNLRIQPNPFNLQTTVFYTVERTGRMQLLANSADGKELRVLDEAQREAGDYQYEWNTAGMAPGIYYVTLLLDGQPVVKRAVKVDR